jgi:hypothetical protein
MKNNLDNIDGIERAAIRNSRNPSRPRRHKVANCIGEAFASRGEGAADRRAATRGDHLPGLRKLNRKTALLWKILI